MKPNKTANCWVMERKNNTDNTTPTTVCNEEPSQRSGNRSSKRITANNWMLRLRNINDYNYTDDKCIDDKNRICFLLSS